MYLIIVGAGSIGWNLTDIATTAGHEVVLIEHDEEPATAAAEAFDCMVLNDDATARETLVEAGADEADAIVCTTGRDATNIMICLLAQELEIDQLVSVIHRDEDISVFRQIGVNAVENPERLIADHLFRVVSFPSLHDYVRFGDDAEVFEIEVGEDAPIAGQTLREAGEDGVIADNVLVITRERDDGEVVAARGETRLESGDRIVVYAVGGDDGSVHAAFEPAAG